MKARNITGQAPGGKRKPLSEVLPLDTPFVVQIFPIYACNFKCNYCIFSIDKGKRHFISDKILMDFDLYKKTIDDIAMFPGKVKVLRFVGIGEPLLHNRISEMIHYAASREVAEKTELITNGSLLTPKLSESLISAGLSRLVVSVQGTTKEKYQEICNTTLNFEDLIENLRYFFKIKGRTHIYIKAIDCALDAEGDEKNFYDIFGEICDTIAIEHAVPIHSGVDYQKVLKGKNISLTQFGLPVSEVKICPQPFFTLQINPDGKVVPCYSFEYPGIMGDCNHESVMAIWTKGKFQKFRRAMLDGAVRANENCAHCNIIKYRLFPEDLLNNHAVRLKELY